MSKDKVFTQLVSSGDGKSWTLSFTRRNCSDCGGTNLVGCNEKLALHYLKGHPERIDRLMELIEIVGMAELWVCQDCKAFGAIPMAF